MNMDISAANHNMLSGWTLDSVYLSICLCIYLCTVCCIIMQPHVIVDAHVGLKPLRSVSAVTVFNIKPQFLEPVRPRIGSTESFIVGTRSFEIGTDKSGYPVPQKSGTAARLHRRVEPPVRFSIWNRVEPGNRRNRPSLK